MTATVEIMEPTKNAPAALERSGADHGGRDSMAPQGYKRCSKCEQTKPLDAFSRHIATLDGRTSHCKDCRRVKAAADRRAAPERMAAAKKKWRQLNPEAVAREARRYAQRHPEQVEVRRKRYEERYPERLASNRAVWTAVKNGELVKPLACEDCERAVESRQLHGHHEDYSKPLEVEWLCAKCHKDRHGGMTKRTDRR